MLGTCCARCLPAKVRVYALHSENGAVTVVPLENPEGEICGHIIGKDITRDIQITCRNPAFFEVSFYEKKT